jgi:hypothetical protein
MLQFIPLTDEYLERDPALYLQLVPFNLDYPCRRLEQEPAAAAQMGLSASDEGVSDE